MRKIMFSIMIMLLAALFGCTEQQEPTETNVDMTQAQAQSLAAERILKLYQYTEYNGQNLRLEHTEPLGCPQCWIFIYQFDVYTDKLPQRVTGYQINIHVNEGRINETEVYEQYYEITEVLDLSCNEDSECETPMDYMIRSNCPYTTMCLNNSCTVVCPRFDHGYLPLVGQQRDEHGCIPSAGYEWSEEKQRCTRPWEEPEKPQNSTQKAHDIAIEHVRSSKEYNDFNGRDLKITNTAVARCPGCFSINLEYLMDSMKNATVTDKAKITLTLSNWEVTDTVAAYGSAGISVNECTLQNGTIVERIEGNECYDNEKNAGEVYDFMTPAICCVEV